MRATFSLKVVAVSGDALMETVQLQTDLTCLMAVTSIFQAVHFKMQKQDLVLCSPLGAQSRFQYLTNQKGLVCAGV